MVQLYANRPELAAVFVLMLTTILAGLLLVFRLRRQSNSSHPPRAPFTPRRFLAASLRLAAFGIGSLVLVVAAMIAYEDFQAVAGETAPTPQPVELPVGFPYPLEEITIPTADGVRLAGWYIPPDNGAVIILLHGYGGTRADLLWHARVLADAGYGALLYDQRASGESGGTRRSYGWEDGPDVGAVARYIQERSGADPVWTGIAGCSVGGQIALQGAIQHPEIQAVWADGPSNIRASDSPPPENLFQWLVLGSNYFLDYLYEQRLDLQAPPPLIDQLDSIAPRPVMLVGGGSEVPLLGSETPRVQRYAEYAGPIARVWVIPQATHCDGPFVVPEEYSARLVEFFNGARSGENLR